MGSYTKIDKNRAQEIFSLYQLGEVLDLTPLSLGISNSNYRVQSSSGQWLLKVSNDKNRQQLEEEQKILLYLKSVDYPYSLCPLPLKDGGHIYHHENVFGVVFPFIEGIPPGPGDQTCRAIGEALAQLHTLALAPNDATIRPHEEVGFGPREILSYAQGPTCPEDFKQAVAELFPDQLDSFIGANFLRTIIHGDLYYDNTLFQNNKLAAMLDFEQAGIGEAILDLGISISGTCLEKGFISPALIKSYLSGYESVRPLPAAEREHLNQAISLGLLSISLWRIKRFREGELDPNMADSYQELLRKALTYHRRQKP